MVSSDLAFDMEANNYFGFTHGGNQYRTAAAAAYQAATATGYPPPPTPVAAPASAAAAAATYAAQQRASNAYEAAAVAAVAAANSSSTAAAYDYGYHSAYSGVTSDGAAAAAAAASVKNNVQAAPPASYYTQPQSTAAAAAAAAAAAIAFQNSASELQHSYQQANAASKSTVTGAEYAGMAYPTAVAGFPAVPPPPPPPPPSSAGAGSGVTTAANAAGTPMTAQQAYQYAPMSDHSAKAVVAGTGYSGYDSAVYNAASLFMHQQQQQHQHYQQQQQQAQYKPYTTGTNNSSARYQWRSSGARGATAGGHGSWTSRAKAAGSGGGGGGVGGRSAASSASSTVSRATQQLHYCDVCRISCAGPQTYREHVAGQKHKKKAALLARQSGVSAANLSRTGNSLRCQLCDVTCTGSDAYAAHVRGTKHIKVLKLHTKLGKPIPSESPVLITARSLSTMISSTSDTSTTNTTTTTTTPSSTTNNTTTPSSAAGVIASVTAATTPAKSKITFVGGGRLSTTTTTTNNKTNNNNNSSDCHKGKIKSEPTTPTGKQQQQKTTTSSAPVVAVAAVKHESLSSKEAPAAATTTAAESATGISPARDGLQALAAAVLGEKDVDPVGHEYVEVINDDEGKLVTFNCKLCDCRFNDPNAKEMHMKGRRHRLQYKRKVDPQLIVEVKSSSAVRQRKLTDRQRRQQQQQGSRKRKAPAANTQENSQQHHDNDEESAATQAPPLLTGSEGGACAMSAAAAAAALRERRQHRVRMMMMDDIGWFGPHPPPPPPPHRLHQMRGGGGPMPPPPPHHMRPPHPALGPPRAMMLRPRGGVFPPMRHMGPVVGGAGALPPVMMRRGETLDDRCVLSRHTAIYPSDAELAHNQRVVNTVEKALKLTSDDIAATAAAATAANSSSSANTDADTDRQTSASANTNTDTDTAATTDAENTESKANVRLVADGGGDKYRVLKGVMRVGALAKGLLVRGDTQLCLVVLCCEPPSVQLLQQLATLLPSHLATVAGDTMSFSLDICIDRAAICLSTDVWSSDNTDQSSTKLMITITLTSPMMRSPNTSASPNKGDVCASEKCDSAKSPATVALVADTESCDVLNTRACLLALAELRRSKWFQARASVLQSCVLVVRVLRDLCRRDTDWAPLDSWCLELLVQRVLISARRPLSAGEALRCVLEAVAGGVLLSVAPTASNTTCKYALSPGLLDPCEHDATDAVAASGMTRQQCDAVTAGGQRALRLMAFRQLHVLLALQKPSSSSSSSSSAAIASSGAAVVAETNADATTAEQMEQDMQHAGEHTDMQDLAEISAGDNGCVEQEGKQEPEEQEVDQHPDNVAKRIKLEVA